MSSEAAVNVQCLRGHAYESDEPQHIEASKRKAALGFLDAPIIQCDECEECQAERRASLAPYRDYGLDPYED